jgi:signal peptidase I
MKVVMDSSSFTIERRSWLSRVIFGRSPRRTVYRLIFTVVLILVLFRWIFIPIRVSGMSMMPTYRDGKVTLVNNLAYAWSNPVRGDVVAFRYPPENVVFMKRIIGLPGDTVRVERGLVYINDTLLLEPYTRKVRDGPTIGELVVRDNEYFVMGDNRGISVLGSIPESSIIGKVLF